MIHQRESIYGISITCTCGEQLHCDNAYKIHRDIALAQYPFTALRCSRCKQPLCCVETLDYHMKCCEVSVDTIKRDWDSVSKEWDGHRVKGHTPLDPDCNCRWCGEND